MMMSKRAGKTKSFVGVSVEGACASAIGILEVAETLPLGVGTVAVALKVLLVLVEDRRCNKEAFDLLTSRIYEWSIVLFSVETGVLTITAKENNSIDPEIIKRCLDSLQNSINAAVERLKKYTKTGFLTFLMNSKKPAEDFKECDDAITNAIRNLQLTLQVASMELQDQSYVAIQQLGTKIEQTYGGIKGICEMLKKNDLRLAELASDIGCNLQVLKCEVRSELSRLAESFDKLDSHLAVHRATEGEHFEYMKDAIDKLSRATSVDMELETLKLNGGLSINWDEVLGVGAFGKVYRGAYMYKPVAVKQPLNISEKTKQQLKVEVLMHSKFFANLGVVRLIGVDLSPCRPWSIVMELADGSLHDAVHNRDLPYLDLSLTGKVYLLTQIASALEYVHALGMIHRDIKSSNVLLFNANGGGCADAKICDFGIAKYVDSENTYALNQTAKGTPPYMSPESWRGEYTSFTDVYSFSILMNEVLSEQHPLINKGGVNAIMSLVCTQNIRPDIVKFDSSDGAAAIVAPLLTSLIERSWEKQPESRGTFAGISQELHGIHRVCVNHTCIARQTSNHSDISTDRNLKLIKPVPHTLLDTIGSGVTDAMSTLSSDGSAAAESDEVERDDHFRLESQSSLPVSVDEASKNCAVRKTSSPSPPSASSSSKKHPTFFVPPGMLTMRKSSSSSTSSCGSSGRGMNKIQSSSYCSPNDTTTPAPASPTTYSTQNKESMSVPEPFKPSANGKMSLTSPLSSDPSGGTPSINSSVKEPIKFFVPAGMNSSPRVPLSAAVRQSSLSARPISPQRTTPPPRPSTEPAGTYSNNAPPTPKPSFFVPPGMVTTRKGKKI